MTKSFRGDIRTKHWSANGSRYTLSSENTLVGAIFETDDDGRIVKVTHPFSVREGTKWEKLQSEPIDQRAAKSAVAKMRKMVASSLATMKPTEGVRFWKAASAPLRDGKLRRYIAGPHVIAGNHSGLFIVNLSTGRTHSESRRCFEAHDCVEISLAQARRLVLSAKRANHLSDDLSDTMFADTARPPRVAKAVRELATA